MLQCRMRVRDSELAEKSVTRFFDALRDVFVGAKVEGESGYINLRRIKSRYSERDFADTLGRCAGLRTAAVFRAWPIPNCLETV